MKHCDVVIQIVAKTHENEAIQAGRYPRWGVIDVLDASKPRGKKVLANPDWKIVRGWFTDEQIAAMKAPEEVPTKNDEHPYMMKRAFRIHPSPKTEAMLTTPGITELTKAESRALFGEVKARPKRRRPDVISDA